MDDCLKHYGTPRHSGRYPYGSGERPYQHGNAKINEIIGEAIKNNEIKKWLAYDSDTVKRYTTRNGNIRKGASVSRVAKIGDTKHKSYKYVSLTPFDKRTYKDAAGDLVQKKDLARVYNYKVNKNLKTASAREVANYILDRDGDKFLSSFLHQGGPRKYKKAADFFMKSGISDEYFRALTYMGKEKRIKEIKNQGATRKEVRQIVKAVKNKKTIDWMLHNNFSNKTLLNDTVQHFIKKGYDAFVDPEDFYGITNYGFMAQYPLVVLDSSKSLTRTSTNKIKR